MELDDPTGYGRALVDSNGSVVAIVEQKVATPEQLAVRQVNSGIYCFEAALLWKHLDEIEQNPISREYLPDRHGRDPEPRRPPGERAAARRSGANCSASTHAWTWQPSMPYFANARSSELMLAGRHHRAARDGDDRPRGQGGHGYADRAVRAPARQDLDRRELPRRSRRRSDGLPDRGWSRGLPYSVLESSTVEPGATIGPFARLRPGNHVGANAHIGNFVELKKTRLAAGAKAGHLSYLGDSEIGEDVNVGAGTITCNYDGAVKQPDHDRRAGVCRQPFDAGGSGRDRRQAHIWRRVGDHRARAGRTRSALGVRGK